jgi:hypothetical protein
MVTRTAHGETIDEHGIKTSMQHLVRPRKAYHRQSCSRHRRQRRYWELYWERGVRTGSTQWLKRSRPRAARPTDLPPISASKCSLPPKWQTWMRVRQPRLLVIWGKYDLSFELSEPEAYRRDVPRLRFRFLMQVGSIRALRL